MITKGNLQFASAVASAFAAVRWLIACLVWVRARDRVGPDGFAEAEVSDDGVDVITTSRRQNFWNMLAAIASCVAAALQNASYFVH